MGRLFRSKVAWVVGGVALILVLFIGMMVWRTLHKKAPPPPPPPIVQTLSVAPRTVPEIIDTSGTVIAKESVEVRPQTTGVLTSVLIHDGQVVRKGQLLFVIDPRPLADALKQARGTLAKDEALAVDQADTERRLRTLMQQDSVAAKTYATALNTLNSLRAAVAADRAAVDQAAASLAYTQVRAPISGRAGAVLVKQGNLAATGSSTPLVVINTQTPIEVSFALPLVHVQAVRNAADAAPGRVLTVSARDSVSGKEIDRGVLIFQSNAFDTTSGTLDFRARFTNARQSLSPGQFVTVRVLLSKGDGVLAVPETALQQGQEGPYVYCLVDGHAKVRQLSVARLVDGQAVVSKGLKAGDEVILTVPNDLRDGSPVQSARDAARKSAAKAPAQ